MIRHTKQGMDAKNKASKVLSFMMARKVPSYEGSYEGSRYGEIFQLLLMKKIMKKCLGCGFN